jgi:hypothetical protein
MQDCSSCGKVIEVNPLSHVCNMGANKYVISNYPVQGENCNTYEQIQGKKLVNVKKQDPLVSFFQRHKAGKVDDAEQKILEAYERNIGKDQPVHTSLPNQYQPEVSQEINFKYALGWISSAVFGGILISLWLLGMIKP